MGATVTLTFGKLGDSGKVDIFVLPQKVLSVCTADRISARVSARHLRLIG
jgi:hypothetical protein